MTLVKGSTCDIGAVPTCSRRPVGDADASHSEAATKVFCLVPIRDIRRYFARFPRNVATHFTHYFGRRTTNRI